MHSSPLDKLRNDHRSLAAVLHGMQFLVDDIAGRNTRPDFRVLRAMIYYIDTFSERQHHPAEDRYLLAPLSGRDAAVDAMLSRIGEEHRRGGTLIRELEQAMLRYQEGGADEAAAFKSAVDSYAEFHWRHMRFEESDLFPAAERLLSQADWAALQDALKTRADPIAEFASEREFERLFSHIVAIAPPPIGVGPAA